MVEIVIERTNPRLPEVRKLIDELDAYLQTLYPAESTYMLDIETLAQPQMRFYSATVDGEMLGCGGFWIHDDYAEVKRVYIHPKSRGLGLGRKIMAHIEAEMLREGRNISRLETGISQPEAIGLYRAIGYENCGAFGEYPSDDPFSIFMEKRLG
jgi:putative acetyltransferase